jgi:hypothetical protein
MSRHGRTKLVSPKPEPENQALETLEESNPPQEKKESVSTELDTEIQCPRCNDIMELHCNFDELVYSCEDCNFLLRCV